MSLQEKTASERVIEARERYVARGVATPPLVVARAEGARLEDVDGRSYIDFAGGLPPGAPPGIEPPTGPGSGRPSPPKPLPSPANRTFEGVLQGSNQVFKAFIRSLENTARHLSPIETRRLLNEAFERGWKPVGKPDFNWSGGYHINIRPLGGGRSFHLPLSKGFIP